MRALLILAMVAVAIIVIRSVLRNTAGRRSPHGNGSTGIATDTTPALLGFGSKEELIDAVALTEFDGINPTQARSYYEHLVAVAGQANVRTVSAWIRDGSFKRRYPARSAEKVLSSGEPLDQSFSMTSSLALPASITSSVASTRFATWDASRVAAELVAISSMEKHEGLLLDPATSQSPLSRAELSAGVFALRLFCIELATAVALGEESERRSELMAEVRKKLTTSYPDLRAEPSSDFLQQRSAQYRWNLEVRTNMDVVDLIGQDLKIHCEASSPDVTALGVGMFRLIMNNASHVLGRYGL